MTGELILQGNVMWSYDHEVQDYTAVQKVVSGLSGIGGPLHNHDGLITLTDQAIVIQSPEDEDLLIPLSSLTQLYHGFDDVYTRYSVKNAGMFWQPLRVKFVQDNSGPVTLYLIIDYLFFYSQNHKWYDQITSMLQQY